MVVKAGGRNSRDNRFWGGGKKKMLKVIRMHTQKVKQNKKTPKFLSAKEQTGTDTVKDSN